MKRWTALMLALCLVLSLSAACFAESAKKPGIDDIRACGQEDSMQLPLEESYLEYYESKYIWCVGGCFVYSYTKPESAQILTTIAQGTKVTQIALQNGMACILYQDGLGRDHAGWVTATNLNYMILKGEALDVNWKKELAELAVQGQAEPSEELFEVLEETIEHPTDGHYLEDYELEKVSTDNVSYVYDRARRDVNHRVAVLNAGVEVAVFARQGDMCCALFMTPNGLKAGWINPQNLSAA